MERNFEKHDNSIPAPHLLEENGYAFQSSLGAGVQRENWIETRQRTEDLLEDLTGDLNR